MSKADEYQRLRAAMPGNADEWIVRMLGVKPQTVRVWNMCKDGRLPSAANMRLMRELLRVDVDAKSSGV